MADDKPRKPSALRRPLRRYGQPPWKTHAEMIEYAKKLDEQRDQKRQRIMRNREKE
jgi:hypothetical protein